MDTEQWEAYYNSKQELSFLTPEDLSDRVGCELSLILDLIRDDFFGELYEDGFFDEHAVNVLNEYLEW